MGLFCIKPAESWQEFKELLYVISAIEICDPEEQLT